MNPQPKMLILKPAPFDVSTPVVTITVRAQVNRNSIIYEFSSLTRREPSGRAERVRDTDRDAIIREARKEGVTALLKEILPLMPDPAQAAARLARLNQLEKLMEGTGYELEHVIAAVAPSLKRLPKEVTFTKVYEDGVAQHLPRNRMLVRHVYDRTLANSSQNSSIEYLSAFRTLAHPLLVTFGARFQDVVDDTGIRTLLDCVKRGKFLTEKQKIRRRNEMEDDGYVFDPTDPCYYSDYTLRHYYDAWHTIFRHGSDLGAWPLGRKLATDLVARPAGDPRDTVAIKPPEFHKLIPHLNKEQRRYVISNVFIDLRPAEQGRMLESHISKARGLPDAVHVPARHAKGKKGNKKPRSVRLSPTGVVWLATCMPEPGGPYLETPVAQLQRQIREIAEKLGIRWHPNFLRHAHDTYAQALQGDYFRPQSHSGAISRKNYQVAAATLEESIAIYTDLPPGTDDAFRKWVVDWTEHWFKIRAGGLPPVSHEPRLQDVILAKGAPMPGDQMAEPKPSGSPGSPGQLEFNVPIEEQKKAVADEAASKAPEEEQEAIPDSAGDGEEPEEKRANGRPKYARVAWPSRLEFARMLRDYKQSEIAEMLHCSQSQIAQMAKKLGLQTLEWTYWRDKEAGLDVLRRADRKRLDRQIAQMEAEEAARSNGETLELALKFGGDTSSKDPAKTS